MIIPKKILINEILKMSETIYKDLGRNLSYKQKLQYKNACEKFAKDYTLKNKIKRFLKRIFKCKKSKN